MSARNAAKIGICIQFAALIRCLAEYYRLKHVLGPQFSLAHAEPFVLGALVTAVCALVGVLLYFAERYRLAVAAAVVNVIVLIALKIVLW